MLGRGRAAGLSATAEQFGSAFGIAVLCLAFHISYVAPLHAIIDRGALADLSTAGCDRPRANIVATESTGLKPKLFDAPPAPTPCRRPCGGSGLCAAAFLGVAIIGIAGLFLTFHSRVSRADRRQKAVAEIVR